MAGVGYTEIARGETGSLYHSLAHGPEAEFFWLGCADGESVETEQLERALEYLGVPSAVIHDAIDQLGGA